MTSARQKTSRSRTPATSPGRPQAAALSYDAAEDTPRRKSVASSLLDEDRHLTAAKRRKLLANYRDLTRNYALAGWILRKHLDFVAAHSFHAKTGDTGLDAELEAFIAERSTRETFDAAQRHPAHRFFRMAEARVIVDGDVGLLKLNDRSLQAIESDRIRDPGRGASRGEWLHGVRMGPAGRALAYAIHRRNKYGGYEFERSIAANKLIFYATYDCHHRFDAVRGVSPVAAACNDLRDLYEARDFALAKLKISQMLGLIIKSDSEVGTGFHTASASTTVEDQDGDGSDETAEKYNVDMGKGPWKLELDEGDDASILETGTPASDSQAFMRFCLAVAMKAVDLPYNFFDEAHTNFFGSKAAVTLYLKSAQAKRENHQEMRREWHTWQFRAAAARGELPLPSGMTADEAAKKCIWIPAGVPWLDQEKELRGDIMGISAGLRTRAEVRRERYGDDWRDVLEKLAQEERDIKAAGVTITEAAPSIYGPSTAPNE